MADFITVATQFVGYYYQTLDGVNRAALKGVYRDQSMMTFENNQVQGIDAIETKLASLPQKLQHSTGTLDAHPSGQSGGIIVMVTGQLWIDGGEHPQSYSQCFHLIPEGETYYVLNDIFRFNYATASPVILLLPLLRETGDVVEYQKQIFLGIFVGLPYLAYYYLAII